MRLDDYDRGIRVEDQRGGRRMGLPIGGRGRSIGCGGLIIAGIAIFGFGMDPGQVLGLLSGGGDGQSSQIQQSGGQSLEESCSVNQFSNLACNTVSSLDITWAELFSQGGENYERPKLVFYSQAGRSGCGAAQSAMGPFYCPADNGIYLDTDFFSELENRFGAGGDFAQRYVIAHEVGHHIQTLTGTSRQVRQTQARTDQEEQNALQVRMELQADCYAGVWAARNRDRIDPGDVEEGMTAAHAIGDDTLMRNAGQRPVEAAFTHGSSEQRMRWLRRGLETGDPGSCNTFAARAL